MSPESKKLFNIIILGVSFMFIFTAFQTCGNIAQTVITNLNSTDFHGSGYTSMSIIYGVFSASNLVSPSVVAIVGPQLSMVVSGIFYSLYIAVFIQPATWAFYTASVFIGIAAAVLWTAQGNCLTVNSDENTIGRNSGVFWALLQSSLFFGNLYIYFAWQGKTHISAFAWQKMKQEDTKTPGEEDSANEILGDSSSAQNKMTRAVAAFKKSIKLSFTKEILLLSVTTAYTGLVLTFFSGVYGTCIGAVNRFGGEEKSLIGLSGIFIGVGEILGGGLFGLLSKNNRFGRNPVVMLGIIVHFIAFYLIFFNMPNDAPIAPMEGTDDVAYMIPSKEVAIFCSFLLGLGDSCFNTQLLSILGFLYSEDSAPAFAIFKFVQSICAAVAYFYSNYFLLQWQLLIMVIFGFFGTITFFTVEWEAAAALVARGSDYSSI
ncbi:UNC93-like protein MFSD11 isoform X2 [Athene cunicularia]|uniref:UNC93-like protein MFSD11 isoform X2 n=1 Tax=Athene cunicularia TaxID=194338 RepID=UPI000EF70822|nr:UNC93-like protein MFSD11 isoform X2 [Athene cunicularia]